MERDWEHDLPMLRTRHMVIGLLLILVVGVVFALGLAAALWHQKRYNEQLNASRPRPMPNVSYQDQTSLLKQAAERAEFDPARSVEVTEDQLRATPEAFHGRSLRVTGTWRVGFESSTFAGAWVRCSTAESVPHGDHLIRAGGVWNFPRAVGADTGLPGFGHMGMSWGEFRIHEIEWL